MKKFSRSQLCLCLLSIWMLFIVTGCGPGQVSPQDADFVFKNGRVYTVNPDQVWAEAVAIKGDEIVFVGNDEDVEEYIGSSTEVINMKNKLLLPGFIDSHAHPITATFYSFDPIYLKKIGTKKILAEVARYAEKNPDKEAIVGLGFSADAFGRDGPTAAELDEIIPDRSAILFDDGAHSAWVNTKTMQEAGITKNTPDPIPGSHFYKRDANGNPTGWLLESQTFNPVLKKLGLASPDSVKAGFEDIALLFSYMGITSVYDAGMNGFEKEAYAALKDLERQNNLPFRIVSSYIVQSPAQVPGALKELKYYHDNYSGKYVHPKVLKIHNDGTVEARTAALYEDYADDPGNKGATTLPYDTLEKLVIEGDQAGYDIHIHAIGDRTITEALDAIEKARQENGIGKNTHTICHVQVLDDNSIKRFGPLHVFAQSTPIWAVDDKIALRALGEERYQKNYNYKSIQDHGGILTFGSDFPVEFTLGLNALNNIEAGITRQPLGKADGTAGIFKEECLTLEDMIRAYTVNGARQLGLDDEVGTIEVGKKADLVLLDRNLFNEEPHQIHQTKILYTMMDGRVVYHRDIKVWLWELFQ